MPLNSRSMRLSLVVLLVAACAACQRGNDANMATGVASDPADYPGGQLLVTVDWLRGHLSDPQLRIIDLSSIGDYRAGHIKGATHVWWQDTIELHNDVYGMMVGNQGMTRLIQDSGITPDSTVVVYDSDANRYAARFLWVLQVNGFQRVSLLNGGRQAWTAAGQPLTKGGPSVSPGGIPLGIDYDFWADWDHIVPTIGNGSIAVVDNRTPEERQETWYGRLRTGKIPGAALVPWSEMTQAGKIPFYYDPETLRQRFADAGVRRDKPVIVYGLDGVEAAQTYVALRLLGYPSVRVYDGSWAEWATMTDLPVEPLAGEAP